MHGGRSVAVLLVAFAAGCGARPAPAPAPSPRAWRSNARQVVEQLRADVQAVTIGGTTRTAAATALADTSDLYGLLVAYSDLGGCRAMVGATGAPRRVVAVFQPACAHLERAAAFFAQAATGNEPGALVRATRESARAQPQLVRAMLAVRRG